MHCIACGSERVKPSRFRRISDFANLFVLRFPYRCKKCRTRFHWGFWSRAGEVVGDTVAAHTPKLSRHSWFREFGLWKMKRGEQVALNTLIVLGVLVCLAGFFYAITKF